MMRLAYNPAKGWFLKFSMLIDRYGQVRHYKIGPYAHADEAWPRGLGGRN